MLLTDFFPLSVFLPSLRVYMALFIIHRSIDPPPFLPLPSPITSECVQAAGGDSQSGVRAARRQQQLPGLQSDQKQPLQQLTEQQEHHPAPRHRPALLQRPTHPQPTPAAQGEVKPAQDSLMVEN